MSQRRTVRVDPRFFGQLDAQLAGDRGPNGEPSAGDFLLVDLPLIAEEFALRFDALIQLDPEDPDSRSLVTTGLLVPSVLVTGVRGLDEVISLISIRIDKSLPWD